MCNVLKFPNLTFLFTFTLIKIFLFPFLPTLAHKFTMFSQISSMSFYFCVYYYA